MAFLAICALPLILTMIGVDGSQSRVELREPTKLPEPPKSIRRIKKYIPKLEAYVNDHFGGRPELIRLNSLLKLSMGVSGSPEVVVGRDGWLFLRRNGDVLDKHRGIVKSTEEELEEWVQEYERRREWLASMGIPLYFFIVPNKHTIYSEYLPARFQPFATTLTDQIVEALRKNNVPGVVDLRGILHTAKNRMQVFTKVETHWSDRGAFEGYKKLVKKIRIQFPRIHSLKDEDIHYAKVHSKGDLSRLIGLANDLKEWISIAEVENTSVSKIKGEHYRTTGVTVQSTQIDSPSALFLCDSFVGDVQKKFWQESFKWSHYCLHQGMALPTDMITKLSPDMVIYIVVERLIPLRLEIAKLS